MRSTRLAPILLLAGCASARATAAAPPSPTPSPSAPAAFGPFSPPHATSSSTKATLKLDSSWSRCHELFSVGSGDVRAEVARLAQSCAEVTRMKRVGEPFAGQQAASARPQTFTWRARGGHCYRAYGVGVTAIKNLDLLLLDSSGAVLGQDGNDDGAPVVLDSGAVCFKQDDEAALVVSVGDGEGAFAVELWGD